MALEAQAVVVTCQNCGHDWTEELDRSIWKSRGDFFRRTCACGTRLYAEGGGTGIRLVGGLASEQAEPDHIG